ncbi:hypothetical protein [Oceanisphaera sp. W20_SRM_FM3]|uniref:hypothetical protein n=1 Tax=Oceanisphaera sp. W20_SRM_FM3 TaxID=3240267 RepID=UPI003F985F09
MQSLLPEVKTMLAILLSTALLTGSEPPSPQLYIQRLGPNQAQVSLCFEGTGQQVRFDLELQSYSPAGQSRTRQSGQLTALTEPTCPVNNQIVAPTPSKIETSLQWWLDEVEQTPEVRIIEWK